MVEGARLESVCTVLPYRGFESLPLFNVFDVSMGGATVSSAPRQARKGAADLVQGVCRPLSCRILKSPVKPTFFKSVAWAFLFWHEPRYG